MDAAQIRERVGAIRWFHSIDLGNGIVTPGPDRSAEKLAQIRMPGDLKGRTVLDIGAWDGFFSFAAARRGAQRVLAVDKYTWRGRGQDGFKLARQVLGAQVEDRSLDARELSPETAGMFDVVLFLGVLYHLKDPQAVLARVASVTRELLILETHVDLLHLRGPAMAFYPGDELEGDPTNWCGPNLPALEWMLHDAGFAIVERVFQRPRLWRAGRAAKLALQGKDSFLGAYRQGRVVYHARRRQAMR